MNNFELIEHQKHAPKDDISIDMLCVRAEYGEREHPNELQADPQKGIIGDRWIKYNWVQKDDGTSDERNQVSILPKRIYEAICVPSGAIHPGDTIIADLETSFESFPIGTQLRVGEVVLEVSDVPNYGCDKWRDRYGMDAWKFIAHKDYQHLRLRGFLCQIVEGGTIKRTDKIMKI